MIRTTHMLMALGMVALLAGNAQATWMVTDDFNSYAGVPDELQDMTTPWTVAGNGDTNKLDVVNVGVGDNELELGKVRRWYEANAYRALPTAIGAASTEGTIFFSLRRTSTASDNMGVRIGFTEADAPDYTNDGSEFNGNIAIGNGDSGSTGSGTPWHVKVNADAPSPSFTYDADTGEDLDADEKLNFWMVLNNSANTFELYMTTNDAATEADKVGGGPFNYLTNSTGAIDTFLIHVDAQHSGSARLYFDDIYVDADAKNLTDPLAEGDAVPEPVSGLLGLLSLGGLAMTTRRRRA